MIKYNQKIQFIRGLEILLKETLGITVDIVPDIDVFDLNEMELTDESTLEATNQDGVAGKAG
jgi:hypothetical protein